jgi:hypothetical protein
MKIKTVQSIMFGLLRRVHESNERGRTLKGTERTTTNHIAWKGFDRVSKGVAPTTSLPRRTERPAQGILRSLWPSCSQADEREPDAHS